MAQEDNAVNSRCGASDSRKGERTEATCTSHSKLPHHPLHLWAGWGWGCSRQVQAGRQIQTHRNEAQAPQAPPQT